MVTKKGNKLSTKDMVKVVLLDILAKGAEDFDALLRERAKVLTGGQLEKAQGYFDQYLTRFEGVLKKGKNVDVIEDELS